MKDKREPGVFELSAKLIEDVRRRAEAEHRAAPPMRTVSKVLVGVAIAATLATLIVTIYGIWRLPDIPIRQTSQGYVGKSGKAYTQTDFEIFNTWRMAMLVTYPTNIALWFLFAWQRRRDEK